MKTMTPMIAAKNMAGKETADSSMLSACPHPAPLHNAIVCANRWFCWQASGHSHFVRDYLKPRHVRGFLLLPPPALGECGQRGLACRARHNLRFLTERP